MFVEVFLVVLFRRPEVVEGAEFDREGLTHFGGDFVEDRADLRERFPVFVRCIAHLEPDAGAVLGPDVVPLAIHRRRIDRHEVIAQEVFGRQFRLIIDDPDRLCVSGVFVADVLIARRRHRSVGVPDLRLFHRVELVEELLRPPEAAAGEVQCFHIDSFCVRRS